MNYQFVIISLNQSEYTSRPQVRSKVIKIYEKFKQCNKQNAN